MLRPSKELGAPGGAEVKKKARNKQYLDNRTQMQSLGRENCRQIRGTISVDLSESEQQSCDVDDIDRNRRAIWASTAISAVITLLWNLSVLLGLARDGIEGEELIAYSSLAIFGLGLVCFTAALVIAINRSRFELVNVPGVFWSSRQSNPLGSSLIAWLLVGEVVVVGVVISARNPYSAYTFASLAGMGPYGALCVTCAKYGSFKGRPGLKY